MTQTKSLDIKHEIKILKKATKKITASRKAARKFLVEHGYHTKDGKLTEKYS